MHQSSEGATLSDNCLVSDISFYHLQYNVIMVLMVKNLSLKFWLGWIGLKFLPTSTIDIDTIPLYHYNAIAVTAEAVTTTIMSLHRLYT